MNASVDFLVEPFLEGELGPHVKAAIDAFGEAGFSVEVGPFGNTVSGEATRLASAIESALRRSIEAGALRLTVDFRIER
ncbi:MAG: thiamine-binding protein [Acidimicrobiia bacterium]|nr:thiamine-binding protein [Acidimicrobiia bacterium]